MRENRPTSREPATHDASGRLYTPRMAAALSAGASFGYASSVYYLLPKYLTETGHDAAAIGAATSAYGLATLAVTPLLALWIDALGHVSILRFACALMALSTTGFLAFDGDQALLVLRAVQGAAFACFLTALTALVIEIAPARRLGEALGNTGASMLVMNAVAPAIAEPLAERLGWHAAFATAVAAAVVATVITFSMRERSRRSYAPHVRCLVRVLRQRRTIEYALVTGAVGAAFGVMFTFMPPYAMELGMRNVRDFFVAYSVAALVARLVFGRVTDRLDRFRMAVFALNLYTIVVLASSHAAVATLAPLGAAMGVAHGLFFPALNAIVMLAVRADERGKMATVFTGAFYGGMALAGLPFGMLAARSGYAAVFTGAAALTFAASAVLVFSRTLSVEPLTGRESREHGDEQLGARGAVRDIALTLDSGVIEPRA